ncbi:MAG TPA: glycosyl hydrolase family 8 [Polyangiaceae bacterium]|jgi:endo-1,4-beta-D-glucanase Y|nr:glycosyl hydrolase family 8 [Polyangiaceae bacterium]
MQFRRGAGAVLLAPALLLTQCLKANSGSDEPPQYSANAGSSSTQAGSASLGGSSPQSSGGANAVIGGSGGSTSIAGAGGASAGSGGTGGMAEVRGPTPATASAKFPFPQNRQSMLCVYPNYKNSDVLAAYQRWKTDMITSNGAGGHLRVQRPNDPGLEPNSTVSEGIGYGMILAVYMNDQPLFDELWKYEQMWLGQNGLMDWYISGDGMTRLGTGGATDADEDMAWALLMADRQWGTSGTLGDTYLNVAKKQIGLVYNFEIYQYKLVKPGDTWGDWTTVNASYFAPSYYRAFASATGNDGWNQVIQTVYDTLTNLLNTTNGNLSNGLVPAWSTSDGVPNPGVFGDMQTAPTNYQYDSCRTPFRIGLDYCLNNEPRAQTYVAKTSQFFAGVGAKSIVDGYQLNGTPEPQNTSGQSAAFVGPATVGAMSNATYQSFVQAGYDDVASLSLLVGGEYYDESWTVLSLLMLSGNFVDYTTQTPLTP